MSDLKDDLLRALRDAYATERHAERRLRTYAAGTVLYRYISERIDADLTDALANQKSLAICLKRIDGSDALLQTIPDDPGDAIETDSIAQTEENVAKDLASLIALKHSEIASYTSLIAIAEASGFFETKSVCEGVLRRHVAMADWLIGRIPSTANVSPERVQLLASATH
jgi:ferritin-like metal-binding protein YciE